MAIANGKCVSFCNQPKVHLASPGYTPGSIEVNVTWMKRGFNACQTHRSMYPAIFNRFPVIQPVNSKVCHLAHFGLPWDNRGKCYMDGQTLVKRIAAYTHLSSTVYELARY